MQVEEELKSICEDILQVLDKHLIPSADSGESRVFYYKMYACFALHHSCYSLSHGVVRRLPNKPVEHEIDGAVLQILSSTQHLTATLPTWKQSVVQSFYFKRWTVLCSKHWLGFQLPVFILSCRASRGKRVTATLKFNNSSNLQNSFYTRSRWVLAAFWGRNTFGELVLT